MPVESDTSDNYVPEYPNRMKNKKSSTYSLKSLVLMCDLEKLPIATSQKSPSLTQLVLDEYDKLSARNQYDLGATQECAQEIIIPDSFNSALSPGNESNPRLVESHSSIEISSPPVQSRSKIAPERSTVLQPSMFWVPAYLHPELSPFEYPKIIQRMKSRQIRPLGRSMTSVKKTTTLSRRPSLPAAVRLKSDNRKGLRRGKSNSELTKLALNPTFSKETVDLRRSVRTKTRRRPVSAIDLPMPRDIVDDKLKEKPATPKRNSSLQSNSFVYSILEAWGIHLPSTVDEQKKRANKRRSYSPTRLVFSLITPLETKENPRTIWTDDIMNNETTQRTVFMMSHHKLSMPRPLVEQVLISNMLFRTMKTGVSITSTSEQNLTLALTDLPKPGDLPFSKMAKNMNKRKRPGKRRVKLSPAMLLRQAPVTKNEQEWKSIYSDEEEENFAVERKKSSDEDDEEVDMNSSMPDMTHETSGSELEEDDEKPLGVIFDKVAVAVTVK